MVVVPVRGSELLPVWQRRGAGGGGPLGMLVSDVLSVGDDGPPGCQAAVKRGNEHRRAYDSPEDQHPDKPPAQRSAASVLSAHRFPHVPKNADASELARVRGDFGTECEKAPHSARACSKINIGGGAGDVLRGRICLFDAAGACGRSRLTRA